MRLRSLGWKKSKVSFVYRLNFELITEKKEKLKDLINWFPFHEKQQALSCFQIKNFKSLIMLLANPVSCVHTHMLPLEKKH